MPMESGEDIANLKAALAAMTARAIAAEAEATSAKAEAQRETGGPQHAEEPASAKPAKSCA